MASGKTQKNFQGTSPSYSTPPPRNWPAKSGQVNFQGEGNAKRASNRTSGQTNFTGKASISVKTKTSHFGEKPGTGCSNGY